MPSGDLEPGRARATRPMIVTSFVPRLASVPTDANASAECDDDPGHVGQGLGVLDDRRRVPQAAASAGYGGRMSRHAAVAGERVDERGLLAGDVGAGALPDAQLDARVGAEDEVAGEVRVGRLAHRAAAAARWRSGPVTTDGDDRLAGADRVRRRSAAPSTTRCGLPSASARSPRALGSAPMRLATTILRSAGVAARDAPLVGGREAGAATTAQAGGLDLAR